MHRVLHLSLAHGGGIVTAVSSFIKNSPQHVRHDLLAMFPTSEMEKPDTSQFDRVWTVESFYQAYRLALHVLGSGSEYAAIHLHSSFAGLVGRLIPTKVPIVYTPHCFAFERVDVSAVGRHVFLMAERLLAYRRTKFAACGPRERDLAIRIGFRESDVFETYNYADVPSRDSSRFTKCEKRVVMVGRLCKQKDPLFYRDIVREFKRLSDEQVEFIWIGDGEEAFRQALEIEGVQVTGWLDRSRLLELVKSARLYLHTAAWEGNPMSVLEAAALNMPIIARDIDAVSSLGVEFLFRSPRDAAALIAHSLDVGSDAFDRQCATINDLCNAERLSLNLARAYGLV